MLGFIVLAIVEDNEQLSLPGASAEKIPSFMRKTFYM